MLTPLREYESFVVGAHALEISGSRELTSGRIGRLPPGRMLKLTSIEPPMEDKDGTMVLRARVRRPLARSPALTPTAVLLPVTL